MSDDNTAAEAAAEDWRDGIEDPALQKVAAKFASPGEVVKSYAALESRLGRSVVKPGPEADEAEIAAYRRQLGVPVSAEGYEINLPEDLPAALAEDPGGAAQLQDFLAAMHKAGATNETVQAALDWYYGTAAAGLAQQEAVVAESRAEAEAALRAEWGDAHDRNVEQARRAAGTFGDESFVAFLENEVVGGVKLGDHPAFLKAFAAIGRVMGEDQPLTGAGDAGGQSLQARIDALHALQDSDPRRYASRAVQAELQGLYAKLYGGRPVVGSKGRRL